MGLPTLALPTRRLSEISGALASTGAKLDVVPVTTDDVNRGCLMCVRCNSHDGGSVRITVHRGKGLHSDYGLVIALLPTPTSIWKTRRANQLSKKIARALREIDATSINEINEHIP